MVPVGYIHEDQYCAVCNGSQDLSQTSPHQKRATCRYYQTGNCRRGSNCPFAHFSVPAQVEVPAIPRPAYQADHIYAYHPLGQTPVYHPLSSQAHPVFLWQPYPSLPLSPSFDPRYGLARQAETFPDYPDDKSDPSSAESSSTAASMDYPMRVALDTAWLEGAETGPAQALASPPGDLGVNSSPGYPGYSYPVFPAVKAEYVVGRGGTAGQYVDQGSMVALPSPNSLPWQDDQRKKPLAYKTKQCKFYMTNGRCTSGEKCTFIHDPECKDKVEISPKELALPTDAKLPPKPLNKYEESHARDYYPITWRVIGGGVMMGGQRQVCPAFAAGQCKNGDDCRFAHETELETDLGFIEFKNDVVQRADGSQQGTAPKRSKRRKSVKAPFPETPQPEVFPSASPRPQRPSLEGIGAVEKKDNEVASSRESPTSPVHRRTQSMSMVVTSPSSLDTTHPNYAAEL